MREIALRPSTNKFGVVFPVLAGSRSKERKKERSSFTEVTKYKYFLIDKSFILWGGYDE